MRVILEGVVVNQVSSKDMEKKDKTGNKTGEIITYRNVDIFISRDPHDPFSQAKAITAKPADNPNGLAAFMFLAGKEGQKVSLLGDYMPARNTKNGSFPEEFKILGVVEAVKMASLIPAKAGAL